jgi:hypothetical protein
LQGKILILVLFLGFILREKAEDEDKEQDKGEEAPPKLTPLTQSTENGVRRHEGFNPLTRSGPPIQNSLAARSFCSRSLWRSDSDSIRVCVGARLISRERDGCFAAAE